MAQEFLIGNVRGPTGPQGPQGPQGPTGPTGATGPQGPAVPLVQGTGTSTTSAMSQNATTYELSKKLNMPNGTAGQVLNGRGEPITPTATPIDGSVLPFTSAGAYTQLALKTNINTTTAPNATNLPIGSYIYVRIFTGIDEVRVGQSTTIYIADDWGYRTRGTGTVLTGTWRCRGLSDVGSGPSITWGWTALFERTA